MNNSFVLHSKSLEIKDDIALINSKAKFYSCNFLIDEKQNLLFIRFNETLTKGNYTLEITYRGLISKNKLETFIYVTYRDRFKGKQWLLLTNIKSNQDASKIFPCLLEDEPTKVTLELSVQHHRGFTALSNTQYNSIIASNEGFKNVWTTFDKTPLLLTRQLNLIIGNLECSTYYDEEYRVWTLKNVGNNHKNLSIIGGKIWKAMKNITGIIDGDTVIKKFYFVLLHGIDFPLIDPFFSYGIIVAK
ncbi:uncharacterized protein LOC123260541 [Cotesia glomerata]|uniref:uncharacterized protein LOC123260541 n=1 Tax=Cotesia glomerata TaxID=32391 RepID=UPI001D01714C|nr:uncharacterized protein LOC123260541 [Cotesia glomerata]